MKFIILSFRKNILPFIFVVLAIALVIFSESNLIAAKSGLVLWANNVVPAIFPFLVITELLSNTNIVYYLGKIFHKIMRPIFNVSGEGAFPLILGLISGYPMGGKIVSDMRNKGICTKDEGERFFRGRVLAAAEADRAGLLHRQVLRHLPGRHQGRREGLPEG